MKKILRVLVLLPVCLVSSLIALSQSLNCSWSTSAGGNNDDRIISICMDTVGNSYATGFFDSPSITFGAYTLSNSGGSSYFIVKYDPAGNVVWAHTTTGNATVVGTGTAIDAAGNIYVTGYYWGAMNLSFGTQGIYNPNVSAAAFIVKYNASGNALWARTCVNPWQAYTNDITVDPSGNAVITGFFLDDSISFGAFTLFNSSPGNALENYFIARYDPYGNALWARSSDANFGISVQSDKAGNTYATGSFYGDSATFNSTVLTGSGGVNSFLLKYDQAGNIIWAQATNDAGDDESSKLTVDIDQNIYLTGYFKGNSVTFGSQNLANYTPATEDMYVVKFDSSGNILWARSAGGSEREYWSRLATDNDRNLYVAGTFESDSVQFGLYVLKNNSPTGSCDMYVFKCDSSGNILWAKSGGGNGDEFIQIAASDGMVNISGFFDSPLLNLGSSSFNSNGMSDLFMANLGLCSAYFTVFPDTVPHNWFALNQSSGLQPITFLWSWGDGQSSTGANVSHIYSVPAYYNICLEITDASGCISEYCDSSVYLHKGSDNTMITISAITPGLSGIGNLLPVKDMVIYPNPATDIIVIQLLTGSVNARMELIDYTGKVVFEQEGPLPEHFELYINRLPCYGGGIYFLRIRSDTDLFVKKLLILD